MSINRVTITGNLTRDPELRQAQSGGQVLRLGVAVNDRWKNPQTQQWEDRPNYIDCVVFGNRAGAVQPHLHKGSKVAIEGRLRWSQWADRETGKNRSKVEVAVDEIEFLSPRQDGPQQPARPQPYGAPPQAQWQQPAQPYGQPQGQWQQAPAYGQQPRPQAAPAPAPAAPPAGPVHEDDIPF